MPAQQRSEGAKRLGRSRAACCALCALLRCSESPPGPHPPDTPSCTPSLSPSLSGRHALRRLRRQQRKQQREAAGLSHDDAVLQEFKDACAAAGLLPLPAAMAVAGDHDATLRRFLRARKGRVDAAVAMLASEPGREVGRRRLWLLLGEG